MPLSPLGLIQYSHRRVKRNLNVRTTTLQRQLIHSQVIHTIIADVLRSINTFTSQVSHLTIPGTLTTNQHQLIRIPRHRLNFRVAMRVGGVPRHTQTAKSGQTLKRLTEDQPDTHMAIMFKLFPTLLIHKYLTHTTMTHRQLRLDKSMITKDPPGKPKKVHRAGGRLHRMARIIPGAETILLLPFTKQATARRPEDTRPVPRLRILKKSSI